MRALAVANGRVPSLFNRGAWPLTISISLLSRFRGRSRPKAPASASTRRTT